MTRSRRAGRGQARRAIRHSTREADRERVARSVEHAELVAIRAVRWTRTEIGAGWRAAPIHMKGNRSARGTSVAPGSRRHAPRGCTTRRGSARRSTTRRSTTRRGDTSTRAATGSGARAAASAGTCHPRDPTCRGRSVRLRSRALVTTAPGDAKGDAECGDSERQQSIDRTKHRTPLTQASCPVWRTAEALFLVPIHPQVCRIVPTRQASPAQVARRPPSGAGAESARISAIGEMRHGSPTCSNHAGTIRPDVASRSGCRDRRRSGAD